MRWRASSPSVRALPRENREGKGGTCHGIANPFYRESGKRNEEVDLVHHGPCLRSMDQRILVYREPHSRPQPGTEPVWSPDEPRGWPPRATHVWASLAQIQPCLGPPRPSQDPNRMTVDRSVLTIDRTHMIVTQEPRFHLSVADDVDDVMMMSAGPTYHSRSMPI